EMDLILGSFADAEIATLSDAELDDYERLLDVADTILLPWMTGEQAAPDDAMIERIIAFRRSMTF
ncbi:succinate dehydrogenase assembly factor 2, partial [bacterium]|nr:succinate dehydrogenase assembly factor 2 [bacterium]